jgi:NTE family protein
MSNKALVLGGGGVAGMAWEIGLLTGLAEAGVDLGDADLVIGTSAGAVVAVHVAAQADLDQLFAAQLADTHVEIPARMSKTLTLRLGWAMLRAASAEEFGVRAGRIAQATTGRAQERRAAIQARLISTTWPNRPVWVTAVDARSGRLEIFHRDSGVPLLDALTASGAFPGVWPPAELHGRPWIDGAIRSLTNAHLASGHATIAIIAPRSSGIRHVPRLRTEVQRLRSHARVIAVAPDAPTRKAVARDWMDPARRHLAALAGRAQGNAIATQVASIWSPR